jgi:hypothetical protein
MFTLEVDTGKLALNERMCLIPSYGVDITIHITNPSKNIQYDFVSLLYYYLLHTLSHPMKQLMIGEKVNHFL